MAGSQPEERCVAAAPCPSPTLMLCAPFFTKPRTDPYVYISECYQRILTIWEVRTRSPELGEMFTAWHVLASKSSKAEAYLWRRIDRSRR